MDKAEFDLYTKMPEGLCNRGKKAYEIVVQWMKEYDIRPNGRVFYSPAEWRKRREGYGTDSYLIITYDGGDLSYIMEDQLGVMEQLVDDLGLYGLYYEQATSWYSAVYDV